MMSSVYLMVLHAPRVVRTHQRVSPEDVKARSVQNVAGYAILDPRVIFNRHHSYTVASQYC